MDMDMDANIDNYNQIYNTQYSHNFRGGISLYCTILSPSGCSKCISLCCLCLVSSIYVCSLIKSSWQLHSCITVALSPASNRTVILMVIISMPMADCSSI